MVISQVILSNWRRPNNVKLILQQLADQTVRFDKIVVVDNGVEPLSDETLKYVDDLWKFPDNKVGPPCRFAPALIDFRTDYTLFLDDDMLPGKNMHKTLLAVADAKNNMFATIGDIGRIYNLVGTRLVYERMDVRRDNAFDPEYANGLRPVDLTCRAHFVITRNVLTAMEFREHLIQKVGPPDPDDADWSRHDDILLCHGIQAKTKYPSYILPDGDKEIRILNKNLPEPNAMWHRPGHATSRQWLLNNSKSFGWNSLVHRED